MTQCIYCSKVISQKIKRDFPGRRYHKKCYFENKDNKQYAFASRPDYDARQQHLRDMIKDTYIEEPSQYEKDLKEVLDLMNKL